MPVRFKLVEDTKLGYKRSFLVKVEDGADSRWPVMQDPTPSPEARRVYGVQRRNK